MVSNDVKPLEADVVCIGGGACGLAAALTAGYGGASVILFEKQARFGGMTNWSEGMFAVGSKYQRRMKLPYTVDDRFKAHMDATHWGANARLVRTFMEKTAGTVDWLEEQGVEFAGVVAHWEGGPFVWHVFKHTIGETARPGEELINKMVARAQEQKNIQLFLETAVMSIIKEGGKIIGVTAQDRAGNRFQVKCKALVCGTGGYGDNREWVERYCKAGQHYRTFMDGEQTGEVIKMAWDVGAAEEGMGLMQAFTFMLDELPITQLMMTALQPNLWVNDLGERFCDEGIVQLFPETTNQLLRQPHARAFNIIDSDMVTALRTGGMGHVHTMGEYVEPGAPLTEIDEELERGIEEDKVVAAHSIAELAEKLGIHGETLEATVDEYNECCARNHDFVFAKHPRDLHALRKPPFYALKLGVVIGITEGGIKVNHKMEAIDKDFKPIPGLYAGGCAVGGLNGADYVIVTSGGSNSFSVVSGRIAGENILKYLGNTG